MKFRKFIGGVKIDSTSGKIPADVSGITCDSRSVRQGNAFVAIKGRKVDGADYISDALAKGASVIVTDRPSRIPRGICQVVVPDCRDALADLSANFYGRPSQNMEVIGVTGTNGKTTVAFLVAGVLKYAGRDPGVIGTVEYRIADRIIPAARTTPDPPVLHSLLSKMNEAGCGSVVMEVSSHALVQKRVRAVDFDIAVFTNLTRDHLDYHKTQEEYFEAKAMLFRQLQSTRKKRFAILNADDPFAVRLTGREDIDATFLTFGIEKNADISAENIDLTHEGSSYEISSPWGGGKMVSSLLGRFNIYNVLAAFSICGALGIETEVSLRSLASAQKVPGRLEQIHSGRFSVFVDYAHTDDALEHVLSTLREITPNRLIIVFGCGGDRDRSKRPAMGRVAGKLADKCYLTSDNPRSEEPDAILREIEEGIGPGADYEVVEDRESAIRMAVASARPGDVVLIAGKGHETFQEFANKTVPFDDRLVARKYL
ncbi:MAG: UDP-N-acetylmuramoyl-L-alanyl-D-glutamate--2,6-diaminopimelate ligase [Verrucomicrobiota bacterium]